MNKAIKDLLASKKFLIAVLTVVANIVARFGFHLDIEQAVALTSPLVAAILGQGIADIGAPAAKQLARDGVLEQVPPAIRAGSTLSTSLLILLALAVFLGGCGAAQRDRVKGIVVDCTVDNVDTLTDQFGPLVKQAILQATGGDGRVDTDALLLAARNFGRDTGACVLASVVAGYLASPPAIASSNAGGHDRPQSAPIELDIESLRASFERVRTELFGGAQYKLASGTL
jgi:urease gamma subunit